MKCNETAIILIIEAKILVETLVENNNGLLIVQFHLLLKCYNISKWTSIFQLEIYFISTCSIDFLSVFQVDVDT